MECRDTALPGQHKTPSSILSTKINTRINQVRGKLQPSSGTVTECPQPKGEEPGLAEMVMDATGTQWVIKGGGYQYMMSQK